jgi:hypothetical protein
LQGQFNDYNVDQVVDLVTIGLLNNNLAKRAHPPNRSQNSNVKRLGMSLVGGPL